tara:strand:+ start:20225 stop:20836 length:612 start_codon:yes stop_codon:yes gene_type:complete
MNWFDILKTQGLVNLPKFKVKPFNAAKPSEEDRECKDKIMKIFDFTENFQFPMMEDIVEGYDDIKIENDAITYINRIDEDRVKRITITKKVEKDNVDKIPEEAFCKLLDFLQKKNTSRHEEVVVDGQTFTVFCYKAQMLLYDSYKQGKGSSQTFRRNRQHIGILSPSSSHLGIGFVVQLDIFWDDDNITEELLDFIKTMEWPI